MKEIILWSELEIGSIKVTGKEGLPFWTIVHFFERTISNHMKVTTIQRICELTAKGVPDNYFSVATSSADVYQEEPLRESDFDDYIVLATKSNSPEDFWNSIRRLKRPVVFFDDGNQRIPLYDFTYKEALRVKNFSENSPFNVKLKGSIGSLKDLFIPKQEKYLSEITSLNNKISQGVENVESIVRASQIVNDPSTPIGVRINANQQLDMLLKAQEQLNHKVGLAAIELIN